MNANYLKDLRWKEHHCLQNKIITGKDNIRIKTLSNHHDHYSKTQSYHIMHSSVILFNWTFSNFELNFFQLLNSTFSAVKTKLFLLFQLFNLTVLGLVPQVFVNFELNFFSNQKHFFFQIENLFQLNIFSCSTQMFQLVNSIVSTVSTVELNCFRFGSTSFFILIFSNEKFILTQHL